MEKDYYDRKQERILNLYTKLLEGEIINKKTEAEHFHVSLRSLQRDIDDLRGFLANRSVKTGITQSIVYGKKMKGYWLMDNGNHKMTNSEVLAVCKILLESRAFTREELFPILSKLLENCSPPEYKETISELIANEQYHYIEPHHHTNFVDRLWKIGKAIQEHSYMEICYTKLKGSCTVHRLIKPVGMMFSEFYFYLIAFIEDTNLTHPEAAFYPAIYRVDRILECNMKEQHFNTPYASRFEEGEFRKRVQFMYGGKLQRITFRYTGLSIEAVLDRLPTATVVQQDETGYTISAEVFGNGIDMWIKSQGDFIEIIGKDAI